MKKYFLFTFLIAIALPALAQDFVSFTPTTILNEWFGIEKNGKKTRVWAIAHDTKDCIIFSVQTANAVTIYTKAYTSNFFETKQCFLFVEEVSLYGDKIEVKQKVKNIDTKTIFKILKNGDLETADMLVKN